MKYIIIAGVIILIGFIAALSQIPRGIEPLTELYLENHTELPKHLFLDKPYNFTFTVNNLEHQHMNYEYIIEAYDEEGELISEIDRGAFFLRNESKMTFIKEFSLNERFERAKINIKLNKQPSETEPWFQKKLWWHDPNYPTEINIHFWVEEIVGTTITITDD